MGRRPRFGVDVHQSQEIEAAGMAMPEKPMLVPAPGLEPGRPRGLRILRLIRAVFLGCDRLR